MKPQWLKTTPDPCTHSCQSKIINDSIIYNCNLQTLFQDVNFKTWSQVICYHSNLQKLQQKQQGKILSCRKEQHLTCSPKIQQGCWWTKTFCKRRSQGLLFLPSHEVNHIPNILLLAWNHNLSVTLQLENCTSVKFFILFSLGGSWAQHEWAFK